MGQADLIADIGGTNVRFALLKDGEICKERVFKCVDYDGLAPAARAYISEAGHNITLNNGAFAIAGPVLGDRFQMTNHLWSFSVSDVRDKLGLKSLRLFNDFHALAMAIPHLSPNDIGLIGDGKAQSSKPIGIIGPGTGLGVASLIPSGQGMHPVPGEGGHVTMPARTQREFEIFNWLKSEKYSHISAERVCSGKGIVNLYNAIKSLDNRQDLPDLAAEEITAQARQGQNEAAREAWELMAAFLGRIAGNLALTLGAHGGIYIAGGIIPQSVDILEGTAFREEFVKKGRFESYLSDIPTILITHPLPALLGLRAFLRGEQSA